MAHITSCPGCGKGYEEVSEEEANNPYRLCLECDHKAREEHEIQARIERDI